jgi:Ca-activated chloride channel family protein
MKKQVVFHIVVLTGLVANAQYTEVETLNNSGIDKITTPAQAEQIFRKATALDTTYAKAPYNLGTALFQENHVEEAFGHLKEAANRSKQPELSHKAFHNIGNVYMQKKEYDNAIEAYKQALRNDPTDEETRYNLALAKKKKEEEQQQDQNQDQEQNQDQDQQENEENKENDQEDKEGDQENEGDQGDSKEKEEKSEDEKGDGSEKEDQKKGQGDQKQEQGKQPENKPSQGSPKPQELSKQQIENLLQALQNEENKVQEKMNAKKVQGRKLKVEKDW